MHQLHNKPQIRLLESEWRIKPAGVVMRQQKISGHQLFCYQFPIIQKTIHNRHKIIKKKQNTIYITFKPRCGKDI